MREIVLDTETTGFDPKSGDRIVEIGCVELNNCLPTGDVYHVYINPERTMPEAAFKVHGLSNDFLKDQPVFSEVTSDLLEFLRDAPLVIHNAKFDMKFLNHELKLVNQPEIPFKRAVDTLSIARQMFPGAQASLDALCRRFKIDNSQRTKHGALLDSELLAEVYLELRGGRQRGLQLTTQKENLKKQSATGSSPKRTRKVIPSRSFQPSKAELDQHQQLIKKLTSPLWQK